MKVKVMSYNIQHGEGLDQVLSLSRIAKNILDSGVGVVGIQEIDKFYGERSNYEDQAKQLSELLGFNYTFGANLDLPSINDIEVNRQYGTAIFSKFPILDYENIFLPSFEGEQRGILRAKLDVNGTHINIYNTHLALEKESRLEQVKAIIKLISRDEGPHLLLGDFNTESKSEELQLLKERLNLKDVFQGITNANTYSSEEPTSRIDYIFASSQVQHSDPNVIQANGSDHLPIIIDIDL